MEPRSSLGKSLTRPVLLNLPIATFGALALAPFLPFFFGLAKKRFDDRDPERAENDRKLKDLISRFASAQAYHSEINDELYPFLRTRLKLPDGATGSEIADTLPAQGRRTGGTDPRARQNSLHPARQFHRSQITFSLSRQDQLSLPPLPAIPTRKHSGRSEQSL